MSRTTNQTTVPIFGYLRGETEKAVKISITHCKNIKLSQNHLRWFPKSQISDIKKEGAGNLEMWEFQAKEWMFEVEEWYNEIPAVSSASKINPRELTGNLSFGRVPPTRPRMEVDDDMDDDIPF